MSIKRPVNRGQGEYNSITIYDASGVWLCDCVSDEAATEILAALNAAPQYPQQTCSCGYPAEPCARTQTDCRFYKPHYEPTAAPKGKP